MPSLFFDTVVIHNNDYDTDSISHTFELFSAYGIQNFIFLLDFDFTKHSVTFQKERILTFNEKLKKLRYRGIHTYVFNNIVFDKGVSFNKDLSKVYASRKAQSLFLELDLKHSTSYDVLAQDINRLIYTKKAFPFISHFDSIIEYSQNDEYKKLLNRSDFGFGFDLNYIFDPKKAKTLSFVIENHSIIITMISCVKDSEFLIQRIGKSNYSSMCYQIQRCLRKILA